jgi:hypothetical protein
MSLFQVIEIDDQWGVFAVPEDWELASVCVDRHYAEIQAAASNRLAAIGSKCPETKEVRPDLVLPQPTGRKFR